MRTFKTHTDARVVQSLYNYDALNRLGSIAYPADQTKTIAFVCDQSQPGCPVEESYGLGRLTRFYGASGSTTLCHDVVAIPSASCSASGPPACMCFPKRMHSNGYPIIGPPLR